MRARVLSVLSLLLATALAGCAADGPDDGTGPTGSPSPEPTPTVDRLAKAQAEAGRHVPWNLSDLWVYDMQVRGFDASRTQLIHYDVVGPEYLVGAPTHAEALHHALFSVNPLLGRIHKDLLSPHERGEHAHMFPFHLAPVIQDGATWETHFYGRQLTLTATYDPRVPTPDGARPGYRFNGNVTDPPFEIDYSYTPHTKWFNHLRAADADGTILDLVLVETGTGYQGPAHFIRAKDLYEETLTASVGPVTAEFRIEQDLVDRYRVEGLGIHSDLRLTDGLLARVAIKDPDGNEIWNKTSGEPAGAEIVYAGGGAPTGPIEERPQWPAGTYTIEFFAVGGATVDLVVVATQDNSGSV